MSEQTFLLILTTLLVIIIVAMLGFLSAVLWQLVKIMREVRGIMANVRIGSDALTADLTTMRSHIKGFLVGRLSNPFSASPFSTSRKRKRASPDTQLSDEE